MTESLFDLMKLAVSRDNFFDVVDLCDRGAKLTMADFIEAMQIKSFPILEFFLSEKFDINQQIKDGYPPPLSMALHDMETTRWMIEHGADPNACCTYKTTPLSVAATQASEEIIQYLFTVGASVKFGYPLHYAVRSQRPLRILELFVRNGASVNATMLADHPVLYRQLKHTGLGTPLHEAKGNMEIINFLMEQGADPTIQNSKGMLPQLATQHVPEIHGNLTGAREHG